MAAKPPTKTCDGPPKKSVENKFDPFRPEMPQIPGVGPGSRPAGPSPTGADSRHLVQIGGIAAAVLLIGAVLFWWVKSKPRGATNPTPDAEVADQYVAAPPLPNPIAAGRDGPTVAATVDELSKPWAAKKFKFVKPLTHENIDALVIRLPGGALWALSLQAPYSRCELQFVTDVSALASQYQYNAGHPMVVDPCDGTVYDPMKVGALGGNTWARGEIVKSSSLRPPISIDVKVSGRFIVADGIE